MWETWVQSMVWEDLLEKAMATHSSIPAWKIPWTREPGRLQSTESQRLGHDWPTSLSPSLQFSTGCCFSNNCLLPMPGFLESYHVWVEGGYLAKDSNGPLCRSLELFPCEIPFSLFLCLLSFSCLSFRCLSPHLSETSALGEMFGLLLFTHNGSGSASIQGSVCVCVCVCVCVSIHVLSCVQLFATPQTVAARLLCPWDSPGKNTGVGCRALLQGIFPTQGLSPRLCVSCSGRQSLYH